MNAASPQPRDAGGRWGNHKKTLRLIAGGVLLMAEVVGAILFAHYVGHVLDTPRDRANFFIFQIR